MTVLWSFFSLLLVLLFVMTWHQFTKAKEIALRRVKAYCKTNQLNMLDDTITLRRVSLARDSDGRLCLKRVYRLVYFDEVTQKRIYRPVVMLGLDFQPFKEQKQEKVINLSDFRE